jgi:2-polyprenyl-3-methyl-5-hydroxy-6-metoxy-1,4-benzoquinol methylase
MRVVESIDLLGALGERKERFLMSEETEGPQHAPQTADQRRDAFVERFAGSVVGAQEVLSIYIGDRLGLYQPLADGSALAAPELADAAGIHERYAREWLEQQAVCGILEVEDARAEPDSRRYRLPKGHDEVLLERDSLDYLAPLAQGLVGLAHALPAVLEAFKTGGGVPFSRYGKDLRESMRVNRAEYMNLLGSEWLPAIRDVDLRLQADPPAQVADVGCGMGWSSIAIARAYPKARVDGFDLDEESIAQAKANAEDEGVADRVSFRVQDAADPRFSGRYDLTIAIDCIHDMSRPVEALGAMRSLVGEHGTAIVMDGRVGEAFVAPGDDMERSFYCMSILHCLPVGMAEQPSAATGAVMRPDTLRRYAREAGFPEVEILPVEHDLRRFYRLVS